MQAFRGEWYVPGNVVSMDEDDCVCYCGARDEPLKVPGRWLAPQ